MSFAPPRLVRARSLGAGFAAVLVLALLGGPAAASSLDDYFGPREISLGDSRRAESTGATAITLNPAGVALDHTLVFDASFGYRGADGAKQAAVSACDSTVPLPGCFYYRYFTAEPTVAGVKGKRRAHEIGTVLSMPLNQFLVLGANVHYFDYNSDLMGEGDSSGFATDLGAIFRASSVISAGVVGYNLVGGDATQYPQAIGAGLAVRPAAALGLSFDGVWNLDAAQRGKGRYGGGVEYFITSADAQSGYPLRAGGLYDARTKTGYLTAGLGFSTMKVGLDLGARYQVSGGDELMIEAGLRLFGPDVRPDAP